MKIEIDEELHPQLKSYCRSRGMFIKDFASEVLRKAMTTDPVVEKKPLPRTRPARDSSEVYTRPPFWENKETNQT